MPCTVRNEIVLVGRFKQKVSFVTDTPAHEAESFLSNRNIIRYYMMYFIAIFDPEITIAKIRTQTLIIFLLRNNDSHS